MKTTLISFNSIDSLQLHGVLFEPVAPTKKIIINVHGSGGNFYEDYITRFAPEFTHNGLAFLAFNNRGSASTKKFTRGTEKIMIGNEKEIFDECVFDIQGAINHAKSLGFTEIIIQGHSLGCNKVVWYSVQKKFDGRLILLAPCDVVNLSRLGSLSRTTPWEADSSVDIFRYRDGFVSPILGGLGSKILVQIGTIDPYIKPGVRQVCDYLTKGFAKATLTTNIVKGADHSYRGFEKMVAENTVKWVGGK